MKTDKSNILIVLDLDETLVHANQEQLEINHDFILGDYYVYVRPYFKEFIDYVRHNFTYAVWSSASDEYVKEMCEKLDLEKDTLFCWARSKTTLKRPSLFDVDGDLVIDSYDHHFFIKRLKKIKSFGYSLDQILIIDDTPHKSQENYGNVIHPSEFTGDTKDNDLLLLIGYLESLKYEKNVRKIEKRNWKEQIKK